MGAVLALAAVSAAGGCERWQAFSSADEAFAEGEAQAEETRAKALPYKVDDGKPRFRFEGDADSASPAK